MARVTKSSMIIGGKVVESVASDTRGIMPITERHIREVRAAGIKDPEQREEILVKAADEELTYRETRAVADAYVAAETPEQKGKVFELSVKLEVRRTRRTPSSVSIELISPPLLPPTPVARFLSLCTPATG